MQCGSGEASERRLRVAELALVLSAAFLASTIHSLHHWWTGVSGGSPSGDDALATVYRLSDAAISIFLLAYVLRRRGRSLAEIGLTLRLSDAAWVLPLWFFSQMSRNIIALLISPAFKAPPPVVPEATGLIAWLVVIPLAAKEELIVRAFLMSDVSDLTGRMGWALVASVGLQTLYHLYQGTPAALIAAGSFFVYAVFYASTRRITPVILAHALHNFKILSWWGIHQS